MMLKAIILYIKHQESVFFFSLILLCVQETMNAAQGPICDDCFSDGITKGPFVGGCV